MNTSVTTRGAEAPSEWTRYLALLQDDPHFKPNALPHMARWVSYWQKENGPKSEAQPRAFFSQLGQRPNLKEWHFRQAVTSDELWIQKIEPLEWALVGEKLYFCTEQDRLPGEYQLRHTGLPVGISIYNTDYVRVQNLTVQGFHSDGIRLADNVENCELLKLECRANGRCGISAGGTCRVDVVGVTCYDNGRAEMIVEQFARVKIRDSDLAGGMVPPIKIEGGNVTVDGVDYQP